MSGHPFNELDLDLDVDTEDVRDDALSGEFTKESALARYNAIIDEMSVVYTFLADVDEAGPLFRVRKYARKLGGELTKFQQWSFLTREDRASVLADMRLLAVDLRQKLTQARRDAESLGLSFIETHTNEGRRIAAYAKTIASMDRAAQVGLVRLAKMRDDLRRKEKEQDGAELFDRELSAHNGCASADAFMASIGGLQGVAGRAVGACGDLGSNGGEAPQHVQRTGLEA